MRSEMAAVASVSCSGRHGYDPATCEELSIKIERHDSLTQTDYSAMIDQNEQILLLSNPFDG